MLCLRVPTDAAWVDEALRDVDAVLADHAHCEMKAASNALSLAARHPGDTALVRALTDLAREEIEHFQRVLALLVERGIALGPPPVDAYAAGLRAAVNALPRAQGDSARSSTACSSARSSRRGRASASSSSPRRRATTPSGRRSTRCGTSSSPPRHGTTGPSSTSPSARRAAIARRSSRDSTPSRRPRRAWSAT